MSRTGHLIRRIVVRNRAHRTTLTNKGEDRYDDNTRPESTEAIHHHTWMRRGMWRLRGCLKSPDSRQILSSMCSLQLPESWNEAYTTFCELGIGRTFQTPSDAFAGASNRLIYGARRTFEFRTKRRCIDSPLLLSPSPTFTIFAPPQILTKPMQNTRPFSP